MIRISDEIIEQIDIECHKTANVLMYALENDKTYNCKARIEMEKIHVTVLIGEGRSIVHMEQSWDVILKHKKLQYMYAVLEEIAARIGEYTEHLFEARNEDNGVLDFRISAKGVETIKRYLSDRAASWMNRFLRNEDVTDWCRNRMFANGFPVSIKVFSKYIAVEGKTVVNYNTENYDDLNRKEEILGMAQCIARNGGNCYIVDLLENEIGVSALMTYSAPEKVRKQW